jgi:ankyrin repeat protein
MLHAIDADGCGALHLAAQDGHADIIRLLKEHGVVDGLPDLKGRCPSDLARQNGHAAVARTLAEGAVSKVCWGSSA